MKKKKKAALHRILRKPKSVATGIMSDEKMIETLTRIIQRHIAETTAVLDSMGDPEADQEWLEFFTQKISLLESGLEMFLVPDSELLSKEIQALPKDNQSPLSKQLLQQFDERLVEIGRYEYQKELYHAYVGLEAHTLRMATRSQVRALCKQESVLEHYFVAIPSQLDELVREKNLVLKQEDLSDVSMAFCTDIWFMMADEYPKNCNVHWYLACKDGWYSAEGYGNEEQAEREGKKREEKGEGAFNVQWIEECWLAVLFTEKKPVFVRSIE